MAARSESATTYVPAHLSSRACRHTLHACPGPSWERAVAGPCVAHGTGDPPVEGSDRVPSSLLPGESPRPVRGARWVRLLSSPSAPGAFCVGPGAERCRPSDASLPGTESCQSGRPRLWCCGSGSSIVGTGTWGLGPRGVVTPPGGSLAREAVKSLFLLSCSSRRNSGRSWCLSSRWHRSC